MINNKEYTCIDLLGITITAALFQILFNLRFHEYVYGEIIQNGRFWLIFYPLITAMHFVVNNFYLYICHSYSKLSLLSLLLVAILFFMPFEDGLLSLLCKLELPFILVSIIGILFLELNSSSRLNLYTIIFCLTTVNLILLLLAISASNEQLVAHYMSLIHYRILSCIMITSLLLSLNISYIKNHYHCGDNNNIIFDQRDKYLIIISIFFNSILLITSIICLFLKEWGYKVVLLSITGVSFPYILHIISNNKHNTTLWVRLLVVVLCYVATLFLVSLIWKMIATKG